MAQSLLTSNGAQSPKPSKYKPIWTDRFFTGLFTNRSPFRSPLSTLYADGYNLGKSDTLIDGVNVELTPRLTLARRPGQVPFSTANTTIANTFYSFHNTDGSITIVEDTATNVNAVTPTAITSIYSKPTTAKQSNFCALGPNLYWGDGTNAQAYETVSGLQRQMGITSPPNAPVIPFLVGNTGTPLVGSSYVLTGVNFNVPGALMSTTDLIPNYDAWTFECWFAGNPSTLGPIAGFESSPTGTSSQAFYGIFFSSTHELCINVLDGGGTQHTIESGFTIDDTQLHHLCVTFSFVSSINTVIPTASGSNQNPSSSITYLNSPTLSSTAAPSLMSVNFFIDGALVSTRNPAVYTLASGSGYWRIAHSSFYGLGSFNGFLSLISVADYALPSPADHFTALNFGSSTHPVVDNSVYINRINGSRSKYFWQLQEPSGTVATDSIGGNTGTYNGGPTLAATQITRFIGYGSTVAVALDQTIVDTNGNLQTVQIAGTTSGSPPTWSTSFGQQTGDGTVTWECLGPAALDASSAQYTYYFSYVNDQSNYSSLSPASILTGWANAQLITLTGANASDPQVTKIAIFRTVAGGSTPFLLAIIPAPDPTIGIWNYYDNSVDGNLNILLAGPQASSNNPPPYGISNFVYHMTRLWGTVGNLLYCSGGPDTIVGNGNEAWPPANSWSYPAPITRIVPSSQGLLVLTVSGVYIHAGGPAIAQFYAQPLFPRVGLASWNALDAKGNEVVLFTSDKQLISIDLSSNTLSDLGYPILDLLAKFDPTKVYVARHHSGLDNAVYVSDGLTGWLRCVPQQAPDYQITGPVWSPFAAIQF